MQGGTEPYRAIPSHIESCRAISGHAESCRARPNSILGYKRNGYCCGCHCSILPGGPYWLQITVLAVKNWVTTQNLFFLFVWLYYVEHARLMLTVRKCTMADRFCWTGWNNLFCSYMQVTGTLCQYIIITWSHVNEICIMIIQVLNVCLS